MHALHLHISFVLLSQDGGTDGVYVNPCSLAQFKNSRSELGKLHRKVRLKLRIQNLSIKIKRRLSVC